MPRTLLALVIALPLSAAAEPASVARSAERAADDWLAVDAPMTAVRDGDHVNMGFAPSISAFRSNGFGAIGARFRGGFVQDAVTDETVTAGTLGFVLRVGSGGPWAEVGGGGGTYGKLAGLATEVGVGYDARLGEAIVSVSARYVHFDLGLSMQSARADGLLVGVGTYFGRD